MKYILTKNQYKLLVESRGPRKWFGKTPQQVEKEITDFVIKNNIEGKFQLKNSEDRDNRWVREAMYDAARIIKVLDKDGQEIKLIDKLFPEKTDEQKIREITDFVIKNNIKSRREFQLSNDRENGWGKATMYRAATGLNILDKLFPKKTPQQVEKEITDFVNKKNIKIRSELGNYSDLDNGWGKKAMYTTALALKVFDKDGQEIKLIDKLFPEKPNEQKIKEIIDFVFKNNIKSKSELVLSSDPENGWSQGLMYSTAMALKVLDKDGQEIKLLYKLFPDRKEIKKFKGKTPEQVEKEIKDFIIKNNIQGRSELQNTEDRENGWGKKMMYRAASPEYLNILDKLFGFEKKEWIGEKKVSDVLKKLGYEVMGGIKNLNPGVAIRQFMFNDCFSPKGTEYCHRLKMDFYLITDKNEKIVIEFNGEQHYKSVPYWGGDEGLKFRQVCDNAKADYCKQNKIRLIVIPYWDLKNIEEILTSEVIPYNKVQESNYRNMKKNIRLTESELVSLIKRTIMENELKNDPNEYGCYKLPMGSEIKDWCDSSVKYIANNVEPIKKIISNVQDELKNEENTHLKHNLKFFDKNDVFFSQNLKNLEKLKELTKYCNSGEKAIDNFEKTIPTKVIFVKKIGELYEYSLLNKLNTNFSALGYLLTQYKLKNKLMSQPTPEVFKKYFLDGEFYKTLMNYFGNSQYEVNLFKEVFNTITNTTKKGRETELKVIEILNKNFGEENVMDFAGDFSFVDMLGVDVLIYMKDLDKWVPVQIKTKIEHCKGNHRFCQNICISKTKNGQWVVMKYVGEQPVKSFE